MQGKFKTLCKSCYLPLFSTIKQQCPAGNKFIKLMIRPFQLNSLFRIIHPCDMASHFIIRFCSLFLFKFVIMADFANVLVFLPFFKRTLIPSTITEIPEVEYTFLDFFTSVIRPKIPGSSPNIYELLSSNVGPQKDSLDPVDSALLIQPVISSFGRFLKYFVCVNGKTESTTTSVSCESTVNAFDVSMDSARQMYLLEHQPPDSSLQPITERN